MGRLGAWARAMGAAAAEALWTTRCVSCDRPGTLLCNRCRLELPYIDRWLACPQCGSPHGTLQCLDCNGFALAKAGRNEVPFERCANVTEYRDGAKDIVTAYKDAGERRLAGIIAGMLADVAPPSWKAPGTVVAYVPADDRARRRRGFDHMELVARAFARSLALPVANALAKMPAHDQRELGRRGRFENMAGTMRPRPWPAGAPQDVILLDDVYTTGATIFAACDALRAGGVGRVRCLTFARVS